MTVKRIAATIATILGLLTVYSYLAMFNIISYPIWIQEHIGYVKMGYLDLLFPVYTMIFFIIADTRKS